MTSSRCSGSRRCGRGARPKPARRRPDSGPGRRCARSSTMCPSSVPRMVSATGSLWSSPSTSTEKMPVIEPLPSLAGAGALQKLRQIAEDARRIAARDRGLAGRQRDVARRMGEARDEIDDEQHRFAAVAEIFGDRHGGLRRQPPHHRALVAGRDDRDGARRDRAPARPRGTRAPRGRARRRARRRRCRSPGERASMASSVDLPTPEPAKMPMRWPAQSGVNRSMTRTPVASGS